MDVSAEAADLVVNSVRASSKDSSFYEQAVVKKLPTQ